MKKLLALLLSLALFPCPASGEEYDEEEDLFIEEIVEDVELDDEGGETVLTGDASWTFAIPLEDMDPSLLVLANKYYKLDKSFVPEDLVKVPKESKGGMAWAVSPTDGQRLRRVCADALGEMNAAIKAEGGYKTLYLKSAYRSWSTQNTMYYNRLKKNKGKDDGWVSQPGASDHQTGLGCDVVPRSWRDKAMNDKMMKEPECQWMAEHCHEFGFIIRYPQDKQDITEINTEPWHLRYVGIPVASYMAENNLCLEEFTEELQAAIADFISRGGDRTLVQPFIQVPTEEQG